MTDSTSLTHRNEGLVTMTLNRPADAMALTLQSLPALVEILYDAADDKTLQAVVVAAAGERVSSAGAELALWWGLLGHLVPRTDFPTATAAITESACNSAHEAVVAMKRPCRDGEP